MNRVDLLELEQLLEQYLDEAAIERLKALLERFGLFISGIEVTQAVQHFKADQHLTDPDDRQADNALRLVSGKPAWVRVYIGSILGGTGVTGVLEVRRRVRRRVGSRFVTVATLDPHDSSMTSVPQVFTTTYAGTRGDTSETLNFVIPSAEMIGTLRLVARIRMDQFTATATIDIDVTLRQTLRLAAVLIAYDGPRALAAGSPNISLDAPTVADLQETSGTALTVFPVESAAEFRVVGTLTQTAPLQSAESPTEGCGEPWAALMAELRSIRTADGNQPDWIYYGLLPSGTPIGPVTGCGGGGVAAGPTGDSLNLAHEAGHAANLRHAPSGGAPNPDVGFPAYEPYDPANIAQGHIGEYGLDINTGNVKPPQNFYDLMGYAVPEWISPYHHGRLVNAQVLSPTTVGLSYSWWSDLVSQELQRTPRIPISDPPPFEEPEVPVFPPAEMQDVISVIVQVANGRVIDPVKVARVRAYPGLASFGPTPFIVNLRDADGHVIASGKLLRLTNMPCGCQDAGERTSAAEVANRYVAQALLPDVAPGASLDITARGETVWRREAPAEPPRVLLAAPKIDSAGAVTLEWEASEGVTECWLRWSREGEVWESVDTGLSGRQLQLDARRLPTGEGFLQLIAHDGFHSAQSDRVPISVPDRTPEIAILHPHERSTYQVGQQLRLWASVVGPAGDPAEAVWSIDEMEVGRGLDTWAALDEEGSHRISVSMGGGEATVTVFSQRLG
jgi:hypothetical protein